MKSNINEVKFNTQKKTKNSKKNTCLIDKQAAIKPQQKFKFKYVCVIKLNTNWDNKTFE